MCLGPGQLTSLDSQEDDGFYNRTALGLHTFSAA